MLLYFFTLERGFFAESATALGQSWRWRSFAPCRDLCRSLFCLNAAIPADAVVRAVAAGLPFDRALWRALAGECLVHGASAMPRLQTAPDTLRSLLAPADYTKARREDYAPIDQAHFGTRDLVFGGGYYRPDHAGINDQDDVARLAAYLERIDPSAWQAHHLERLADFHEKEEREEELAYVRDWWPELVKLYQDARERDCVIVCEAAE
jgi:hypothetical protein